MNAAPLFAPLPSREDYARTETTCRGCGKPKDKGLVVCWHCFKYRDNPYKYFAGTFEEWLVEVEATQ